MRLAGTRSWGPSIPSGGRCRRPRPATGHLRGWPDRSGVTRRWPSGPHLPPCGRSHTPRPDDHPSEPNLPNGAHPSRCRVALPVDAPAAAVDDPAVTHCLMTVTLPVGNGTTMDAQRTDENSQPCLSVRSLGPEAVVIATGEFDLASAPAAAAVFADVLTETCRRVVIDVSGVTFLDAAGLRALRAESAPATRAITICFRAPSRPGAQGARAGRHVRTDRGCPAHGWTPPGRRMCAVTTSVDVEGG